MRVWGKQKRMGRFSGAIAAPVLAGCVLIAGCSGSKSSTTSPTTAATAAGDTSTSVTFSGSANSTYCNLARQFTQSVNPGSSPDAKTAFQEFDQFSGKFLANVPAAIHADAVTVINAIKQLEVAFQAANYDPSKVSPSALTPLEAPSFTASINRVDAYDTQVCGLTTSTS